jgi:hypothetical protein
MLVLSLLNMYYRQFRVLVKGDVYITANRARPCARSFLLYITLTF